MKAILMFNVPEEVSEYKMHMRAPDYYLAISDIMEYLRGELKYKELPPIKREFVEKIRDKFIEILGDRNVSDDFF